MCVIDAEIDVGSIGDRSVQSTGCTFSSDLVRAERICGLVAGFGRLSRNLNRESRRDK
jgi:hypothetical protein